MPDENFREARDGGTRQHFPPVVVSLTMGSDGIHRCFPEWFPPPGWNGPSILDFPIYPSLRKGLLFGERNGWLRVHDPRTLDSHTLNETAVALLLLCNGARSIDDIRARYARERGLDSATARRDLRTLAELIEKKVLVAALRPSNDLVRATNAPSSPPKIMS